MTKRQKLVIILHSGKLSRNAGLIGFNMSQNLVKSLTKAISILKCFNPRRLELGVNEISRELDIPSSTAHRLVTTLLDNTILEQDPITCKYRIGHTLYAIGSLYVDSVDLVKAAEPVMKMLNDCTGETIYIGILENTGLVTVHKEQGWSTVSLNIHIGMVVPAHSSSTGKALLSELPETQLDELYPDEQLQKMTKNTIDTRSQLKKDLEEIRKSGVSYCREECYEGIKSVASVIRNGRGRVISAISISVPVFRMNKGNLRGYRTLVRMAAELVSQRLGYKSDSQVFSLEEIHSWWEQKKKNFKSNEIYGRRALPGESQVETGAGAPSHA